MSASSVEKNEENRSERKKRSLKIDKIMQESDLLTIKSV